MRRLFRDVQRVPETSRRLTRIHVFTSAARARVWLMAAAIALAPMMSLASQRVPTLRTETTTVRSYDGREMPAEILRITVPERRAHPGRSVTVGALRLRASTTNPGYPIVFLMGGPGIPGTVMAPIPAYFTLFQRLRAVADVILVDQRGLRSSEPVLDCPFTATLPVDAFVTPDRLVAAMRAQVATCAEHWRAQGAEPTAYNTLESADDIDDLRQSLGVDKIDLLAFSYGTRLALAVVQRHGAHVGRVVLQGVNGPGLVVKRPGTVARKLQRIGELLKQDSSWQAPTDLLTAARTARERLGRSAVPVIVDDRSGGQGLKLLVGREGFDAIVALNLDDARLPALLISVAAGDDRVLTRFVEAAWNGLGSGTVGLMARAVNCAADRPAERWAMAAKESATAPFGAPLDNASLTDDFCGAVGYDRPPVEFAEPLHSSAAVLMITGALDATNPIENAREVARGFPNAVVLEVENVAHEALPVPVVQDIVVDFFNATDVRGRRVVAERPQFTSVAQALRAPPQRGR